MIKTKTNNKEIYNIFEKHFSHDELINLLEIGNIIEKQYAILNLDTIKNKYEANLLVSNLTGIDGKVREPVSYRLNEFINKQPELFYDEKNYEIFANASIDIDGNVCRNVIEAVKNLESNIAFSKSYAKSAIDIINNALDEISKFTFRDRKYKINKQIFKIYWCLMILEYFHEHADYSSLKEILKKCSNIKEYTIREKCAKILSYIHLDKDMLTLQNRLKYDENYYVRIVF